MAKLYFRYGAMNSGKSLFLISTAYNFKSRNINCAVMKPSVDTRDIHIKSRAFEKPLECMPINKDTDLIELVKSLYNPQWILVDEAQFLTPNQVDTLAYIVDNYNINIICYGLRTDFQTKLFPGSQRLFEIADTIEEMKTTCSCGKRASVNARIDSDGNIITEGSQIECGAEDKYITLCRDCYNKRIEEQKNKNNMNNITSTQEYDPNKDLNLSHDNVSSTLNTSYVYESNKDINYIAYEKPLNSTCTCNYDGCSPDAWYCPKCGAYVWNGALTCPDCGTEKPN